MEFNKKIHPLKQKRWCFLLITAFSFSCPLAAISAEINDSPDHVLNTGENNPVGGSSVDGQEKTRLSNPSAISKPVVLPDDDKDVLLLEVSVGPYNSSELLAVRQYKNIIFIPLGALSDVLDLAIHTDPSTGIAKGFVITEKNTFYLDINRGEVTLSGVMKNFDNQRTAARVLDDIYVDSDLLTEWLPLSIDIDLYASRLKIKSDKALPFVLRKQRESRMKMIQGRIVPLDRGYPGYTAPYEPWGYPQVDFSARAGLSRNKDGDTLRTYSHTTYATADLFNMESAWYVAGNQDEFIDDTRVTFGRKSINGELLGPLKAREYAFGHVVEPRMDLINRPTSIQPGLFVSNYPLTRQQQYDSHSFSGDLPPDWEVELYRNNSLLDYRPAGEEGRYEFENVPLLYGHNYFRLVFYGPQGQIREETHTFELGQSLTLPGEQNYRIFTSKNEDEGNRTIMQYDVGINKHVSASASFVSLPIKDNLYSLGEQKDHRYLTAGVTGYQKSFFYKLNYTRDTQSGTATDWGVQSRLGPVILNFSDIYFNDFISEAFVQSLIPIQQRRSLKMDTAIPTTFISRIPISLEYQRDTFDDGSWISRFVNRVSAQKYNYALTNTLVLGLSESNDDVLTGVMQISRRANKYNLRGNLGYQIKPEKEISSITLTADGFKMWDFNASAGITKVLSNDNEELIFGLNRRLDGYVLGMDARVTTDGSLTFNLTFNTGLAREPRSGRWDINSRPVANQGALSALAFIDANGDGQMNPDEEALPGVRLNLNGSALSEKTDENGIAFYTGLAPYREVDIDVSEESLADPLLLPAIKGLRVDFRPGHVMKVDFPIIESGEIDGSTFVSFDGVKREASGVVLELVNEEGKIIRTVKTAYDGFYVMGKLPLGTYKLRVSEQQINELGLLPVEPKIIEITGKKQIINGQDFVLTGK